VTPADAVARERDEARKELADLRGDDDAWRRTYEKTHAALLKAQADAARLREVLAQVRDAMLATGQGPDGDDDPRRPLAAAVWRALASAPWDGLGPDFVEATL